MSMGVVVYRALVPLLPLLPFRRSDRDFSSLFSRHINHRAVIATIPVSHAPNGIDSTSARSIEFRAVQYSTEHPL